MAKKKKKSSGSFNEKRASDDQDRKAELEKREEEIRRRIENLSITTKDAHFETFKLFERQPTDCEIKRLQRRDLRKNPPPLPEPKFNFKVRQKLFTIAKHLNIPFYDLQINK